MRDGVSGCLQGFRSNKLILLKSNKAVNLLMVICQWVLPLFLLFTPPPPRTRHSHLLSILRSVSVCFLSVSILSLTAPLPHYPLCLSFFASPTPPTPTVSLLSLSFLPSPSPMMLKFSSMHQFCPDSEMCQKNCCC